LATLTNCNVEFTSAVLGEDSSAAGVATIQTTKCEDPAISPYLCHANEHIKRMGDEPGTGPQSHVSPDYSHGHLPVLSVSHISIYGSKPVGPPIACNTAAFMVAL